MTLTERRAVTDIDAEVAKLADLGPAQPGDSAQGRYWAALHNLYVYSPLPDNEKIKNLGLWHPADYAARFLIFADLWRDHILNVHGSVLQFGVRFGQDLTWLIQLRGLLEPASMRKMYGFDTFNGHIGHSDVDGDHWMAQDGAFDSPEDHSSYVESLALVHANASRLVSDDMPGTVRLVVGDVRETLPDLLRSELESLVVGAAFFDLDIYEPTKAALEAILPRCHRGTLLVFDELDSKAMPGETLALLESVGLNNVNLRRDQWDSMCWTTLEHL